MSTKLKIMVAITGAMLILSIASCKKSTATATPTSTGQASSLSSPTDTLTPLPPTETPTPMPIDLGGLVTGTPVPMWNDIPVMPDAIAGVEKDGNYLYTTKTTTDKIAFFYAKQMLSLGWNSRAENGTPGAGGILTLVYVKGAEICIIGIVPQQGGALVMLGKQKK